MTAFKEMTPGELAAGCRQVKTDASHEPYCFELFRRAILQKSEHCWSALYAQYSKLADAFTAFWRAFTAEKLGQAERLAQVLSYLRACTTTAVLQAKRREDRRIKQAAWDQDALDATPDPQPTNSRPEQLLMTTMWQEKLWQIVNRCCHDERERVLARLSFISDLKPSEILERHPDLFVDVAEIYTMRRNLKNRLWRDKELQELWGEPIL